MHVVSNLGVNIYKTRDFYSTSNYEPAAAPRAVLQPEVKVVDNTLIIRRWEEPPAATVAGLAEVVVYLDGDGRIYNVEIEFLKFYSEKGRETLQRARW
ncbi:hypothetical protein Pisl_2011 [Pyrobaculum islandicum DSM 4184]|uniref:Uncharacterized protein n=1 Tax=Pyrobaculum islandicum (strain DSM 4184 / JCM 9189 / GEO3) TaxID=384616 RepID=A1RW26_PYRIL|nr:hypothetical protein [Pyrobaculum islandicum]ABL89158.1 hypothetical protein Pisl_2011 [Pyrobaculum islandicum DSM 4184]